MATVEGSLRYLMMTGGAMGPNMVLHAPELVDWLTEYALGDARPEVDQRDLGLPAQKILVALLGKIQSPDLERRMNIMLGLEPGYEESTITMRAADAGRIGGLRGKPEGVSGKHYRERLFDIDVRKAADEIVAAMNEEHEPEMRAIALGAMPASIRDYMKRQDAIVSALARDSRTKPMTRIVT